MSEVDEFFQAHQIEGSLSPEQAAELMSLAGSGDIGALAPEQGDAPIVTPEAVAEQQPEAVIDSEVNAENSVLMAKDGKHTIPFEKLVEAREGERHWKQQAQHEQQLREQALQELELLRTQAQARVDAGQAPTQADMNAAIAQQAIDAGVDPAVFGDMDEEGLANGVLLISQQVAAQATKPLLEEIKALKEQLAPVHQRQVEDANQAHFASVREKHPDFESIVESQELADWINSQPSFVRDQMNLVVEKGNATQAIELLDAFKSAVKTQTPAPGKDVRAAAQAAIESAKPAVPASLSDFQGGKAVAGNRFDAISNMDAASMADALAGLPPDQVEAFLSRTI